MVSLELTLHLPNELAREAEAAGLLTASAISGLLETEVRRRRIDKLFNAAGRLAAIEPPLSEAEIEAEIQAAREERRAHERRS